MIPNVSDNVSELSIVCYCNILQTHLNSKSALQRMISALVLNEWAELISQVDLFPVSLKDRLQNCLMESIYFDEIALSYTKILQDTKDYIALLRSNSVLVDENLCNKVNSDNEIHFFFCH